RRVMQRYLSAKRAAVVIAGLQSQVCNCVHVSAPQQINVASVVRDIRELIAGTVHVYNWFDNVAKRGAAIATGSYKNAILAGRKLELVRDRKSTRLNSSHQIISYAVFCLKQK